jgi:hypothetical protein
LFSTRWRHHGVGANVAVRARVASGGGTQGTERIQHAMLGVRSAAGAMTQRGRVLTRRPIGLVLPRADASTSSTVTGARRDGQFALRAARLHASPWLSRSTALPQARAMSGAVAWGANAGCRVGLERGLREGMDRRDRQDMRRSKLDAGSLYALHDGTALISGIGSRLCSRVVGLSIPLAIGRSMTCGPQEVMDSISGHSHQGPKAATEPMIGVRAETSLITIDTADPQTLS